MTKDERLEKVCKDFCSLGEGEQEYILGMSQALVFANEEFKPIVDVIRSIQEGVDHEKQ
jgi:hypothetical protein